MSRLMIIDAPFRDQCLVSRYRLRLIDSVASRRSDFAVWWVCTFAATPESELVNVFYGEDELIDDIRGTFPRSVFGFSVTTKIDWLSRIKKIGFRCVAGAYICSDSSQWTDRATPHWWVDWWSSTHLVSWCPLRSIDSGASWSDSTVSPVRTFAATLYSELMKLFSVEVESIDDHRRTFPR